MEFEQYEAIFFVIKREGWYFSTEDFYNVEIIEEKCECGGKLVCVFFEGCSCRAYYSLHVCLNVDCTRATIKKHEFFKGDIEHCLICNRKVVY